MTRKLGTPCLPTPNSSQCLASRRSCFLSNAESTSNETSVYKKAQYLPCPFRSLSLPLPTLAQFSESVFPRQASSSVLKQSLATVELEGACSFPVRSPFFKCLFPLLCFCSYWGTYPETAGETAIIQELARGQGIWQQEVIAKTMTGL